MRVIAEQTASAVNGSRGGSGREKRGGAVSRWVEFSVAGSDREI